MKGCTAFAFFGYRQGIIYLRRCLGFNGFNKRLIFLGRDEGSFWYTIDFFKFQLHIYNRLHGLVSEKNGFQHIRFADNIAAAFYHYHTGL